MFLCVSGRVARYSHKIGIMFKIPFFFLSYITEVVSLIWLNYSASSNFCIFLMPSGTWECLNPILNKRDLAKNSRFIKATGHTQAVRAGDLGEQDAQVGSGLNVGKWGDRVVLCSETGGWLPVRLILLSPLQLAVSLWSSLEGKGEGWGLRKEGGREGKESHWFYHVTTDKWNGSFSMTIV